VTEAVSPSTISALFNENRTFPPPAEFARRANCDASIYEQGASPELFWAGQAGRIAWRKHWDSVLDWSDAPFAKWFDGATLNITESCLDQHLAGRADKVAYYWEGEPGDSRTITYRELHREVCRAANALASLGVQAGDRVAIYMGMVPELPIAMLACARLGAPHSVVFGGFASDALRDRILDAEAKVLITCDGAWRAGSVVPLKDMSDAAVAETPSVSNVLVVRRTGQDVTMIEGRDIWWHDLVPRQAAERAAAEVDAEPMLFILYTSGTTAKPKGIVHTTGGYAVGVAATHHLVFDLKPPRRSCSREFRNTRTRTGSGTLSRSTG
jgi:acetyl-CoA synthetase